MERHRGWLRGKFAIPADAIVIGNIGRLTEVKNNRMALEGFRRYLHSENCNARMVFFGDGTLRRASRPTQSPRIAAQVHFVRLGAGARPHPLRSRYRRAHLRSMKAPRLR